MRPYHPYQPDQASLLPASLAEAIPASDPVFGVRDVVSHLDLSAIHRGLRSERGRPPFHPQAMVGLLLYGACRGIYSSRRLQMACRQDLAFMYLMGRAQPDFRTIAGFRQRFRSQLRDLFRQVLEMCRAAGLVRLGHVSLDGTKVRANASKHKAMSYERMLARQKALEAEIESWLKQGEVEDAADDEDHGPDDDGFSLPEGWQESLKRLAKIEAAKARLEEQARERAQREGFDPDSVTVGARAQTNFTDPESRIMHTPEGFQQSYNAQAAVDADSGVIVAQEVSQAPPDVQRLVPMLAQIVELHGRAPLS
jgi:transposase